jgi:hypothetical protein
VTPFGRGPRPSRRKGPTSAFIGRKVAETAANPGNPDVRDTANIMPVDVAVLNAKTRIPAPANRGRVSAREQPKLTHRVPKLIPVPNRNAKDRK